MLQKFFTGSSDQKRKNRAKNKIYEGHFTLKMFRARMNKYLQDNKPLTDLLDLYACMLVVGLGDIYDDFVISDDIKVTDSCKKCFLERKIPENYAFLIDQWEENGNLYGINTEDLITDLAYNKKLTFDYASALDCLKLQPTAILSIFTQIMSKEGEYFRILPDSSMPIALNPPSPILSGMTFPILACKWPNNISIKIKDKYNIFVINENDKIIDVISLNTFPVYTETLNQRKNFFWHGGEEEPMLICNNYQDLGKTRKILGDNLLIRPLGENFVRSGWFKWGPDAIFAARCMKHEIYGVNKLSSHIKTPAQGYNWLKVTDFGSVGTCDKYNCVFSDEDIKTIDKLINGESKYERN
jgi:hypothetical protein